MRKIGLLFAIVIVSVSSFALAQIKGTSAQIQQVEQAQSMQQPKKSVPTIFTFLMAAIEENNYGNFVAQGNVAFKQGITKEMFTQVSAQLAPRMKKGYSPVFLGELKQQGYQVYLWKLTFLDGGDDFLARLSLKDGEVGGFLIN
ncbi:MAG: hypothetical protein N4J56_007498 [Chroococcidiopsis sp. SAG 2025]|uniref:hypothetical protein n=1 Tax=Chroococcidiopsis sp. SAG 2025 TaxID=171389 RepID=UPI0029370CBD|nr:hypothetical protein [Chroococcidiopsis sp. SAG 2025]MDV2997793.1 hypothetical protein [Chroococcidiopsis sp. SAG 2025]